MIYNDYMIFFTLLSVLSILITRHSYQKSKSGSFFTNTPNLSLLGIYVWGDGLVLAPFWLLVGLAGILNSLLQLVPNILFFKLFLLFHAIRSGYEVIYWLNHQAVKSEYKAPLFENISWLNSEQAAILYQLLHTCTVVFSLVALFAL